MGIKEDLARTEFYNRENTRNHLPYDREIAFYQSIKNGDMEEMKRLFQPLGAAGYGRLSGNSLRNHKYHLVITVAFITRYCIEGGLEMETAYNLSDLYIRKIDTCASIEELDELHVVDMQKQPPLFKANFPLHRLHLRQPPLQNPDGGPCLRGGTQQNLPFKTFPQGDRKNNCAVYNGKET